LKEKQGVIFNSFVNALKKLGYEVDFRELRACDYGAPTIRKRFFMIARRDGRPIVWPEPTHGDPQSLAVKVGKLKPWRTASEIIDWNIEAPSIFRRKKTLAANTMRRIELGIKKFVLNELHPFKTPDGALSFLTQYYTETNPGEVRGQTLKDPIYTIPTANRFGLVKAFLVAYYGSSVGQDISEPLHTITTRDRFGLVTVNGQDYQIADIGLRMLQPHELYAGQGFPDNYIIDRDYTGKPYPKTEQVARCGNAVPPPFADALVRANLPEFCVKANRYKRMAN
jgi:DNA (cytosine-5)-methyltransferase 1